MIVTGYAVPPLVVEFTAPVLAVDAAQTLADAKLWLRELHQRLWSGTARQTVRCFAAPAPVFEYTMQLLTCTPHQCLLSITSSRLAVHASPVCVIEHIARAPTVSDGASVPVRDTATINSAPTFFLTGPGRHTAHALVVEFTAPTLVVSCVDPAVFATPVHVVALKLAAEKTVRILHPVHQPAHLPLLWISAGHRRSSVRPTSLKLARVTKGIFIQLFVRHVSCHGGDHTSARSAGGVVCTSGQP